MDLNLTDSSLKKKYIYADRQILAQHACPWGDIDEGEEDDFKYFYLHDRLGSVRLVINDSGNVVKYYTYEPFGEVIDDDGTFENALRFTGQYFDAEIEEYYLRTRQYNPAIARFTARDPVFGKLEQPLTLHKYLYCQNDSVNFADVDGRWALMVGASASFNFGLADIPGYAQTLPMAHSMARRDPTLMEYYNILLPVYTMVAESMGFGGTAGAGIGIAKDENESWNKGWSAAPLAWYSAGLSVSTGAGASVVIDVGFSPEAQKVEDLGGRFVEAGASGSLPVPSYLGINTGGATCSWGIDENDKFTGITLWTVSFGWGASVLGPGKEAHAFQGRTRVGERLWGN
jgi:RHS repeat-associated protein